MNGSVHSISNDLDKLIETLQVVRDHLKGCYKILIQESASGPNSRPEPPAKQHCVGCFDYNGFMARPLKWMTMDSPAKMPCNEFLEMEDHDDVGTDTETATYDLAEFWNTSEAAVKLVSIEATKLCLAFAQPPLPQYEVYHPLIEQLGKSTLAMITCFYNLSLSKGATLNRMVRKDISRIIDATITLLNVIKLGDFQGSQQHLQSTGTVWEYCDQYPNIPRDNKHAVLHVGTETSQLVTDALEEIQEALQCSDGGCGDHADLSSDDQNDVSWSEEDKQIIIPSVALIKASSACMKRVLGAVRKNGKCECPKDASQLDNLAEQLNEVSPAVDEVVLGVYPPINKEVVRENMEKLGIILQNLLECAKHIHITTEDDLSWLEFLLKAVLHNMNKMEPS